MDQNSHEENVQTQLKVYGISSALFRDRRCIGVGGQRPYVCELQERVKTISI